MRRVGTRLVGVALLVHAAAWGPARAGELAPPALERGTDGHLVLVPDDDVLRQPAIRRQLDSGLTTVFEYRLEIAGGGTPSVVRVEVRLDLWDEIFLVRWYGSALAAGAIDMASREELSAWWQTARMPLREPPRVATRGEEARAVLTLTVAPFSAEEQEDAQHWFSTSRRRAEAAQEVARVADDGESSLQGFLDTLLATSIDRAALLRYRWRYRLPAP